MITTRAVWTCAALLLAFPMLGTDRAAAAVPLASTALDPASASYRDVVTRTANMVSDANAQRLVQAQGLNLINLTWEDTGRYKDSAVGPNISDMTIQVQTRDPASGQYHLTCMPVIRFNNFDDRSADIDPKKFFVLAGNEKGQPLRRVNLYQLLGSVRKHLTKPGSWKGDRTSLLADRDSHVLVSAQACFLPVPKEGFAEFNPVLFNYQSIEGDPAVLTILATREGTSITVIDNKRDAFQAGMSWGQRLFFNHNGERASLTGQRLSDFRLGAKGREKQATPEAAGEQGLNMVLLIQVPLKQKNPMRFDSFFSNDADVSVPMNFNLDRIGDVEVAVIGHGKVEGPFTELANLNIERDPAFPVRVTVQFYKATSNGVITEKDVTDIRREIDRVYTQGDFVGSLVTAGATGRPTEHAGDQVEPPDWWEKFWQRYEANTGRTRAQVIEEMRRRHGAAWFPLTEQALAQDAESLAPGSERWPLSLLLVIASAAVVLVSVRLYSIVRDMERRALVSRPVVS
jgi:hypothetical protein